jgi:hypothetical protein
MHQSWSKHTYMHARAFTLPCFQTVLNVSLCDHSTVALACPFNKLPKIRQIVFLPACNLFVLQVTSNTFEIEYKDACT